MDRSHSPPPTSSAAVCVWIPLFALRCEEARRPELVSQPGALLAADAGRRVVWQVSPLARHAGGRPGMTVSQAIGLCPALRLCEPDPVHYDERFALLLAALARVSPVVEPAELGLAYVGTDGLEGLYGGPEQIVEAIRLRIAECGLRNGNASAESAVHNPLSAIRVGWGKGKFVAWVAATRAKPGGACIVHPGEEGKFLASQPVAVLPLDPGARGASCAARGGACRRGERGPGSSAPPRGSPRPRSRIPPRTATTSLRRSRRAWRRRRAQAPSSGSSSSSPPSPRAPPSCSSSPGTRAPPRGPADCAPCGAPSRRSRSGSSAPCCITSSRSSHGPVFRSAATR